MKSYDPGKIEKKWQKKWAKDKLYKTPPEKGKKKCYVLDMFPYPSGEGLHVGHPKGYIATDVYSRYKKMNGYNVLHPMGWDAFGLPAEQYALKTKTHPRVAVEKNVKRYKEQLSVIGPNYDWAREINTTDPEFYKWTQWAFLQMFKKGLVYESHEPINWCPSCQTGLANEDLEGNACERCGTIVEKRPIRQWVIKITKYADKLLKDVEKLNWPESIKESQRNWIGRSEGAEIDFKIEGADNKKFTVFTTRPDTLFGATYCVLAPEHKLLDELQGSISNWSEVAAYREEVKKKTEIERTAEGKDKTGVKLVGVAAINPANNEPIPIFVADYVLGHYGTGAIMAVPAHDERDFAFANKFGVSIKHVIAPETGEKNKDEEKRPSVIVLVENPNTGKVLKIKWGKDYSDKRLFIGGGIEKGEDLEAAARREILEETGYRNVTLQGISGTVFHHYFSAAKNKHRMTEAVGLHFTLIDEERGEQKLDEHEKDKFDVVWVTKEESGKDTADALHFFMHEYFLNAKPHTGSGVLINSDKFDGMDSEEAKNEITKFVKGKKKVTYKLRDWVFSRQRYWGEPIPLIHCEKCGVVPVSEKDLPVKLPQVTHYEPTGTGESPLAGISKWVNTKCPKCKGPGKRETNTMPQWAGSSWYYLRYIDPKNKKALVDKKKERYWSPVDMYVGGAEHATRHLIYARFWHKFLYDIGAVNYKEPFTRLQHVGLIMAEDGRKMSKRYGNVINPDDIVATYGADTLRLYEMFMGPFDQSVVWSTQSIVGARRFIERVWRFQEWIGDKPSSEELEASLHRTVKKVDEDIEQFGFNTAIAAMMTFANDVEKEKYLSRKDYEMFLRVLAPFTPHVAEEMWSILGNKKSVHLAEWPKYNKKKIVTKKMSIAVQVDGKVRADFEVGTDTAEEHIKEEALKHPHVLKWTEGREVVRVIYVKGRLVSVVTKAGT